MLLAGADTVSDMLEPEIEELAGVEAEPRAATHSQERNWWLAIITVFAGVLLFCWLLGQLL